MISIPSPLLQTCFILSLSRIFFLILKNNPKQVAFFFNVSKYSFYHTSLLTLLYIVTFTDKRIQLTNEILTGIRMIKAYAWEEHATIMVEEARTQELYYLKWLLYYLAANAIVFFMVRKRKNFHKRDAIAYK